MHDSLVLLTHDSDGSGFYLECEDYVGKFIESFQDYAFLFRFSFFFFSLLLFKVEIRSSILVAKVQSTVAQSAEMTLEEYSLMGCL